MRQLLSLEGARQSPLLKGPYISLSRSSRKGASVDELIWEGFLHPHMRQRIPGDITHLYGHQEEAIRAITSGKTTLVSTGTGSGKTECFLYPIISKCLQLRDEGVASGISAVIVYPMNALAEDQLGRMRSLDDPYEEPEKAEVVVNTAEETIEESLAKILKTLELMGYIPASGSDSEYSEEEEEEIKKRLADLGYI